MNEYIIVGIVAIAVIFGATKLPEIARNLGRSSNEFKKGLKEGSEDAPAQAAQTPVPPPQAAPTQAAPTQAAPTQAVTPPDPADQPHREI